MFHCYSWGMDKAREIRPKSSGEWWVLRRIWGATVRVPQKRSESGFQTWGPWMGEGNREFARVSKYWLSAGEVCQKQHAIACPSGLMIVTEDPNCTPYHELENNLIFWNGTNKMNPFPKSKWNCSQNSFKFAKWGSWLTKKLSEHRYGSND